MDIVRQEVVYALRGLRRPPGFALVAVLLVALSVGVSTAVFSIVNAVYFSAVPYRDPGQLVLLQQVDTRPGCTRYCHRALTIGQVRDMPAGFGGIETVAGLSDGNGTVTTPAGIELGEASLVTGNFFAVLGLRPLFGRPITASDDHPGAPDVAVLGYSFWMSRFGGDRAVLGRAFTFDGHEYTIVGVMPASAGIGNPISSPDEPTSEFFIPIAPELARLQSQLRDYDDPHFNSSVVARLAPGTSLATLQARLDVRFAGAPIQLDDTLYTGRVPHAWHARATPLRVAQAKAFAASDGILFAAVLVVALIASVNLAGLFLARRATRRGELALRAALGASRARLVAQGTTEGALVAVAGALLGLGVAHVGAVVAKLLLPAQDIPYWTSFTLDGRVLAFTTGLTAISTVIFGLAPALWLARGRTLGGLPRAAGADAAGRQLSRVRRGLVSVEIACTLVLAAGAGLLVRTFYDGMVHDTGMVKHGLLIGSLWETGALDSAGSAANRATADALLARLRDVPGVEAAAVMAKPNLRGPRPPGITREGDGHMIASDVLPGAADGVSPDYFRVYGRTLLAGRAFTDADGPSSPPVVILDAITAQHLFPDERAIGRRIKFGPPSSTSPWMTIVGVVSSTSWDLFSTTPHLGGDMFRPLAQMPTADIGFVIRTRGPDAALAPAVRQAVHEVLPSTPVSALLPIEGLLDRQLAPVRANTVLLGVLAALALIIAALGIYGVIAYLVVQRTAELGIRLALGATPAAVRGLLVRAALRMVAWGVGAGLVGAVVATRVLRSMLPGATSTTDPRVFAAVTILLALVALAAAYLPARRAARIDPVSALRRL